MSLATNSTDTNVTSLIYLQQVFSVDECNKIIEIGSLGKIEAGVTWSGDEFVVDTAYRAVQTSYMPKNLETAWIYSRIETILVEAARLLQIDVDKTKEDIKYLRYDTGNHFQAWHMDTGTGYSAERKLSISVELSNTQDFHGGELEIIPENLPKVGQGGCVIFPSIRVHRVTPVTCGVRHALVSWISGPPYR